eukprot:6833796-Pyramimonas_sp.AAC.1
MKKEFLLRRLGGGLEIFTQTLLRSRVLVSIPRPTLMFCLASSARLRFRRLLSSWQPRSCRAGRVLI